MSWLEVRRFFKPLDLYDPLTQLTELTRLADLMIAGMAAANYASDPARKEHRISLYEFRRRWWRPVDAYCRWRSMVNLINPETIHIHDTAMDGITALQQGSSWRRHLQLLADVHADFYQGDIFGAALGSQRRRGRR
jgi:hypothetical protein